MGEKIIRARNQTIWNDHVSLWIADRDEVTGKLTHGGSITFHEIEDYAVERPPTLVIELTQAQMLMDELWECGLRPTEGKGSAGALEATRNHLKDMRRLVYILLNRQGKFEGFEEEDLRAKFAELE